jgi:GT2 family glycosyltransferase
VITICLTYFRSLTLANLRAALYSLQRQNLAGVDSVLVVDNNTADPQEEIIAELAESDISVPVRLVSFKHQDPTRTHAWSTNVAVSAVATPWVVFTRADYILDFDLVAKFRYALEQKESCFVTGLVCHLQSDVSTCEASTVWRERGPSVFQQLPHVVELYTEIDTGVWGMKKDVFDRVGGLDERLTAWGHAQTHFQGKLRTAGVEFVKIPEVLFYHPMHAGDRDLGLAHQQLADIGVDVRELWDPYIGRNPYR